MNQVLARKLKKGAPRRKLIRRFGIDPLLLDVGLYVRYSELKT